MRFLAGVIAVASVIVVMAAAHRALAEEEGRYQVVAGAGKVIMVDTRTGRSWWLLAPPRVWQPIPYVSRVDDVRTILPRDEPTEKESSED